jgi:hypothetical protein
MTRKNKHSRILLIFFNLFLILILLIIIDPLVGVFIEENEGETRNISFKENKPNSVIKVAPYKKDKLKEPVVKRTDKHGFILGPGEKSTDKIDFIFLGSSTVENENVRENKRYPYLSIENLNQQLQKNYISRNAGVGGNLISNSNLSLTVKIVDLNPKYIVLSSSLIDILYLSKNESYWTGSKKLVERTEPGISLLKSLKELLFPNLWLQARKFIASGDISDFHGSQFSPKDKHRILSHYEKQLDVFIKTCQIYNIKPILMTDYYIPELIRNNLMRKKIFNSEEANYYVETLIPSINNIIETKSRMHKIPLIRLNELVEKNELYINVGDGVHLTNLGNEKVSKIISTYLAQHLAYEKI